MVVRLSALRTGRLYPRKYSWYSFLLEVESTPGPQCDRKDFMSMKNPLTPARIKPATFRFVAQHPNHCAIAVPQGGPVQAQNFAMFPSSSDESPSIRQTYDVHNLICVTIRYIITSTSSAVCLSDFAYWLSGVARFYDTE